MHLMPKILIATTPTALSVGCGQDNSYYHYKLRMNTGIII